MHSVVLVLVISKGFSRITFVALPLHFSYFIFFLFCFTSLICPDCDYEPENSHTLYLVSPLHIVFLFCFFYLHYLLERGEVLFENLPTN